MSDDESQVPVKVLVIDDELQIRRLLTTALETNVSIQKAIANGQSLKKGEPMTDQKIVDTT